MMESAKLGTMTNSEGKTGNIISVAQNITATKQGPLSDSVARKITAVKQGPLSDLHLIAFEQKLKHCIDFN